MKSCCFRQSILQYWIQYHLLTIFAPQPLHATQNHTEQLQINEQFKLKYTNRLFCYSFDGFFSIPDNLFASLNNYRNTRGRFSSRLQQQASTICLEVRKALHVNRFNESELVCQGIWHCVQEKFMSLLVYMRCLLIKNE